MTWTNNCKLWLKNHDYAWKFKLTVCLPIFSVLVLLDWGTKLAVQFSMEQGDAYDFIPNFLHLRYIINPGSAYGANSGNATLAITLATVVTLLAFVIFIFLNDKKWLVAITFILGGSFANLLARAWAPAVIDTGQKGGVIDFLMWGFSALNADGYVFNLADLWVNLGVIILVIALIIEIVAYFNTAYHRKSMEEFKTLQVEFTRAMKTIDNGQSGEQSLEIVETKVTGPAKQNLSKKEQKAVEKLQKMKEKQHGKNN